VIDAIVSIQEDGINSARADAERYVRIEHGATLPKDHPLRRVIEETEQRHEGPRRRRAMDQLVIVLAFWAIGDKLQFDAEQLSARVAIDPQHVKRYLSSASAQFGDLDDTDFLNGNNPLRSRPLLRDEKDLYLCVSLSYLLFGLRPAIERSLRQTRSWEPYQRHRRRFLETETLRVLSGTLRTTEAFGNVHYVVDGRRYEADVLVGLGSMAIVAENKAQSMSDPAVRAAPATLKEELKRLIGEAGSQARRLRESIEAERLDRLIDEHDRPIEFVTKGRKVVTLSVTLEDMSALASSLDSLLDAEIVDSIASMSMTISLADLEVICELTEWSAELLHFIKWRDQVRQAGKLIAYDELDSVSYTHLTLPTICSV